MIVISKFSGKCDCYDSLVMIREVTDFSKVKIFRHIGEVVPLRIDSQKDLAPFYPFLAPIMTGDKDGNVIVYLSDRSFVDIEEEDILTRHLDELLRYWRRCKRKKVEFNEDEALKMISWFEPEEHDKELVRRVMRDGDKATIDGIHIPSWDHYRQELNDEMIRLGWDKNKAYLWCFGWSRWVEKLENEKN